MRVDLLADLFVAVCLVGGSLFALVGSIGLVRLDDFYSRLHGPTKATTLGVGGTLAGSAVYFSTRGTGVSLHEILVLVFLFLTAPVSAHLLSRAALRLGVPNVSSGLADDAAPEEGDTTSAGDAPGGGPGA